VTDVPGRSEPLIQMSFAAVRAGGIGTGPTTARRKDGTEIELRFRGRETRIAGMTFYVGIAWPAEEPA
jgi:hypothetical protein